MKEIEVVDQETGEIKLFKQRSYMSKHGCINYDPIKHFSEGDGPFDEMIEFAWWGTFPHLRGNYNLDDNVIYNEVIKWCEENCQGLVYGNHLSGKFSFEIEEDAFAFRLRWE